MRNFILKSAAIGVAAMLCTGALAEDKPAMPAAQQPQSMEAMMAEMMKLNQLGPEHAELKKAVGTWTAETRMRMTPDAPEMVSKGTEVNEMILNDRFLKSSFTGDMMGQTFKGMALTGYDTVQKKYVSIWMDDSSNAPMITQGTADATGKVITLTGKMPCPVKNMEMVDVRQVLTRIDDDHTRMEMFSPGPDGKEFRGMLIEYSRGKIASSDLMARCAT